MPIPTAKPEDEDHTYTKTKGPQTDGGELERDAIASASPRQGS